VVLQCGIDEAGRGPLAGPVTAACAIIADDTVVPGLGDSKSLSPARREKIARALKVELVAWGLGWAWPEEIDRLNIHHASLLAMQRAYHAAIEMSDPAHGVAGVEPVYVDGRFAPDLPAPVTPVVGGDATIPAVQAASILAKTARDAWMVDYARQEPVYRFEKHKGYPTPEHKLLIQAHGPSRIHRHSFNASI
jgi:ribonuclease HII